ncbi:hypothetical protein SK128_026044, partial [Halocaridina rubra]
MGIFGQSEFVSIDNMNFRVYSDEEIKKISVLRITNHETFNDLGHIAPNGLYDLHLGPVSSQGDDICLTCRLNSYRCPGHCGHIELPLPVYNPVFYDTLKQIVTHICFQCHHFIAHSLKTVRLKYQMKLLNDGFATEAMEISDVISQITAWYTSQEAEEVTTGIDDEENESKSVNAALISILPKKLDIYCSKVLKNGTSQSTLTCGIYAIRDEILKKFWHEISGTKKCSFCSAPRMQLVLQNSRFIKKNFLKNEKESINEGTANKSHDPIEKQSYLTALQVQDALRKCWQNDSEVLSCLYPVLATTKIKHPTDMFFLNTLLVIPPKFRPYVRRLDMISEHESGPLLKNVVKLSTFLLPLISIMNGIQENLPDNLKNIYGEISGKTTEEKIQNMWYQIQANVDNLYDAGLTNSKQITSKGIRQVIEKKYGLMRHNLMGKRVNFSARSVAAPDPHLAMDEVGVPMDFAIKLSYPVPVSNWNVEEMRKLVMNGPHKYPGAIFIEDEEGKKILLGHLNETQRCAHAKKLFTPVESHVKKVNAKKIVHRHLKNGDFVLMNRQPTLHRPSIQAHRVRVMAKDRVLRMPYANCKAYNADFDGDEFNMHFPQNELARSESRHLIMTHNQYLTPKDGSPLAGLIQDCVVSSVLITVRGKFFSREDYQQLVYVSLSDHIGRIKSLPPCIIKPKQLWSGKQIISTLLHNLIPESKAKPSFTFKTSVKVDLWQTNKPRGWITGGTPEMKREAMTESEFVMRDGELLCGVIDKSAIGSTSHGLIHTCYDLYGGSIAYKLLTSINRMCVYYLQWSGHTIDVKDFITPRHVSKARRKHLKKLVRNTPREVCSKLQIPENDFQNYFENAHKSQNAKEMAAIDAAYTAALGPTTSRITAENERQLLRPNLDNHMKLMVDTGAKGSKVNMNQMASLFGSVAIDGKRMPLSITGKSLPAFKPYDSSPCAGGYIANRFITGINPKSYFFLCIVGRDSLQHTAVKTSDSGYVQRCLIKHLEGVRVDYDMTVRNSDGMVLQFRYGEDGLDVTKVPFMSSLQALDALVTNYSRLIEDRALATARAVGERDNVDKYSRKLKRIKEKHESKTEKRCSGFLKFCRKMADQVDVVGYCPATGRSNTSKHLQKLWQALPKHEKEKFSKKTAPIPDPVSSVYSSAANLGVVSEALDKLIDQYYSDFYVKRPASEQTFSKEDITTTIHMKALMSQVDPGEAVGALCAQALGEPLTQMTLNTFHFAGKDELNVTLGVPRMIEILRTGSKEISTPIMEIPFHPHVTRQLAEKLRLALSEVSLDKLLSEMNVVTKLEFERSKLHRTMKIKFSFLPHSQYKHVFALTPDEVLKYVENQFLVSIEKEILKSLKQQKIYCSVKKDMKGASKVENNEDMADAPVEEESETIETMMKKKENDSDNESSDEEEGLNEDDAKANQAKELDYSDVEDESNADEFDERESNLDDPDENGLGIKKTTKSKLKNAKGVSEEEANDRIFNVKSVTNWVIEYDFDRKKQLWCEVKFMLPVSEGLYDIVSIVRGLSKRAYVNNVSGMRRVFVVEKDGVFLLRTEGINIMKMFAYEHLLDINKLYTNSIQKIAETYGIEAAQRAIIREIRAVQSAYDINVNFRHLSLLADYFTCEGKYKACNRAAISTCASPIQKMSFETCVQFLKSSLLHGEIERMNSPSANIAVGQPPK